MNWDQTKKAALQLARMRPALSPKWRRSPERPVVQSESLNFGSSMREWSSDLVLRFLVHEISQPMTALVGSADLLRRRLDRIADLPPEVLEDMARVQASVTHIKSLLNNARDRLGPANSPRCRFSLSASLRDLLAVASSEFSSRGAYLVFRPIEGDDLVEVNPTVVAQILWNLLRNALEANTRAGLSALVQVHVQTDPQWVSMIVSDTGDGIPPSVSSTIGDQQPIRPGQNMGLGLGLCHELAAQQGGHLSVVAVAGLAVNGIRVAFPRASQGSVL